MLQPAPATCQKRLLLLLAGIGLGGCGTATHSDPAIPTAASADALPADLLITAPGPAPAGMSWIPGGAFQMGSNKPQFPDEAPAHRVVLDGFWIDQTEVTNAQFQEFVTATGYVTIAEKKPKREDFAGQVEDLASIPEENLVAGSICYNSKFDPKTLRKDHPLWPYQVWKYVADANWKQPEGPGSNLEGRGDHPAVHLAWDDAQAYCQWKGHRLPTEAEWEYAARGGRAEEEFPWGNERTPQGAWQHNIWQGEFPLKNEAKDGFVQTSPVKTFPPNGYGLYDVSGNVWEWCHDWYQPDYYTRSPLRNPTGPAFSTDPLEPNIPKRVQRGGSFMCSDNYCLGYRVAARMKGDPSSGTFHAGFRTVLSPRP